MSECKFGYDCPECVKDKCSRYRIYEQGRADALNIDMDEPMHFTDKQKAWIKNYIIINAKRQRAEVVDEFVRRCKTNHDHLITNWNKTFGIDFEGIDEISKKLKEKGEY